MYLPNEAGFFFVKNILSLLWKDNLPYSITYIIPTRVVNGLKIKPQIYLRLFLCLFYLVYKFA